MTTIMAHATKGSRPSKTRPRNGGQRPPRLPKTERNARIIRARAEGKSYAVAAEEARCSDGTAFNVAKAHAEHVESERRRLQMKVLKNLDAPVRARLKDAGNADSRTGPASFRELREGILDWAPRTSVLLGDMNIDASASVVIDARSIHLARDPESSRMEMERLSKLLGAHL